MPNKKVVKASSVPTLSRLKKEMAKPRVAKSAQQKTLAERSEQPFLRSKMVERPPHRRAALSGTPPRCPPRSKSTRCRFPPSSGQQSNDFRFRWQMMARTDGQNSEGLPIASQRFNKLDGRHVGIRTPNLYRVTRRGNCSFELTAWLTRSAILFKIAQSRRKTCRGTSANLTAYLPS